MPIKIYKRLLKYSFVSTQATSTTTEWMLGVGFTGRCPEPHKNNKIEFI